MPRFERLFGGVLAAAAVAALTAGPAGAVTPDQFARAEVAHYSAPIALTSAPVDCTGPAGDPAPGTPAWNLRDAENQYCATQRMQDEYLNPAFGATFWSQTALSYPAQNIAMAQTPGHLHASLAQFIPGGTTTDPFRTILRWQNAGRGFAHPITFPASDGATLNGYIFMPPASVPKPEKGYPGVVITTGSIQGYQQMYFWAAEGLAEAGYEVMTYDVQGQGNSDTLPAFSQCSSGGCTGVPFQQSYNFYQGSEDALNFFLSTPEHPYTSPGAPGASTYNTDRYALDADRVGIAGHSLGAGAVSEDGQCDPRVKAIVAWDNLATNSTDACNKAIPNGLPNPTATPSNTVPALGINSEYFLNPEPATAPPGYHSKDTAFAQLSGAGTDSMQIALRSSMHLEYSYVPYILPGSHYGERVAFYYTLAWLDRYLGRGSVVDSAYARLRAMSFDTSSDAHSIGGGVYDPAKAVSDAQANPGDPGAGNVPTTIAGLSVKDRLSFYYDSEYRLTPPDGGSPATCVDMRAVHPGC